MKLPFTAFQELGYDATLLLSLVVGIGFGLMLERGGFGGSKVLAGIFYGRDWRVLKVMFSAIVTAMIGLYTAQGLGWVALDQLAFKSTYLWGQIAGGLLLGAGFVTSGYCPGTSVVGAVSGRLDAIFVMIGLVLGLLLFEEVYPLVGAFYESGYLGEVSLSEWMGLPTGVVVLMVVLMALGAFSLVAVFERRREGRPLTVRTWRQAAGVGFIGLFALVIQLAGPGVARAMSGEQVGSAPVLQPLQLAGMAVEARNDVLVIDLRGAGASPALPGAVPMAAAELIDLRRRPVLPADSRIIVVDDADTGAARQVVAALRGSGLDAIALSGGAAAWSVDVVSETALDPRALAYRILVSGESSFGGAPPAPPRTEKAPPKRKQKKSGSCS